MSSELVLTLANGARLPQMGFGTLFLKDGQPVRDAIEVGYRAIDCAWLYRNQKLIGETLQACFKDGIVKREDLFITSKIWSTRYSTAKAEECLNEILTDLQLDYLDLCLLHNPMGLEEGQRPFPSDDSGKFIASDIDFMEPYRVMEAAYAQGRIRNLGLSNFNARQIERVVDEAKVKPVNLQVELHPYFAQRKLVDFCRSKGLSVTAYASLANAAFNTPRGLPLLLDDPVLKRVAERQGKTAAQVALRWALQRGLAVIPKSNSRARIEENFGATAFELTDADVAEVDALDRRLRYLAFADGKSHREYPFGDDF